MLDSGPIDMKLVMKDGDSFLELTSSKLIKNLYLDVGLDTQLSDNYFDLLPNRTQTVKIEQN